MRIAFFSNKKWVKDAFDPIIQAKKSFKKVVYFEPRLTEETVGLAKGFDVVCAFVNDEITAKVIDELKALGVKLIALRCAGFNNVDIKHAKDRGIPVVRVPAYSPFAVAEHALGMILTLNRKFHRAFSRVRDGNFSLDGLLGFDVHKKTIGIIGTGKIGQVFARLVSGFDCKVLGYDKFPNPELEKAGLFEYADLSSIYEKSDIISLHCPLTFDTFHLINEYAINSMKQGVMIINTSRGPLIDSNAVIQGLKDGKIGYLGLDVYEEEDDLFFEDLSGQVIQDDTFVRLLTFPNVLITGHQAFFSKEAVHNIAETTIDNVLEYFEQGTCSNQVVPQK